VQPFRNYRGQQEVPRSFHLRSSQVLSTQVLVFLLVNPCRVFSKGHYTCRSIAVIRE